MTKLEKSSERSREKQDGDPIDAERANVIAAIELSKQR
jgi:hypothetical protein